MKNIKYFQAFESLVDKKIQLLRDICLDLQDAGLEVEVKNGSYTIQDYTNRKSIIIDITDINKKFGGNLYDSEIIKDFIETLMSYKMRPRSISGGSNFVIIKLDKHGSMTNSPLIRESIELDLKDILLELEDIGYRVVSNAKVASPVDNGVKAIFVRDNTDTSDVVGLPWSELKDYALRIKDYLGDKYLGFMWRPILINHQSTSNSPYKTIELNEDTEIEGKIWSFAIKYKD